MTCIVGLIDGDKVHMGCDSVSSDGYRIWPRNDCKMFCRSWIVDKTGQEEKMLIGFTTSWRMGQLLRYDMNMPDPPAMEPTFQWMVKKFVRSIRRTLHDGGFAKQVDNVEKGGTFLVGYRGQLFRIESDYQVMEIAGIYDSVGSGWDHAMGSLHTSLRMAPHAHPRIHLTLALEAAETYMASVGGPFHFDVV